MCLIYETLREGETVRVLLCVAVLLCMSFNALASTLDRELERYIVQFKFKAIEKPIGKVEAVYKLGEKLFFDPLLSGNKNISCASCHDPAKASGDALPLPIGVTAQTIIVIINISIGVIIPLLLVIIFIIIQMMI